MHGPLPWTVAIEENYKKNQKWFENPFIKDKSDVSSSIRNTMHKKYIKFVLVVELTT